MKIPQKRLQTMTVAGMMSGTSGDGVDIALVRIGPQTGSTHKAKSSIGDLNIEMLAHRGTPFPAGLRAAVLAAQDARKTSTAELARLHWRLGLAYARAFEQMTKKHPGQVDLVGCHGQTIYHQAKPAAYLGARFGCTWQIGEMAMLAQAAGAPVVSNFRPADMVAGGQGAPLVPILDEALYRDKQRVRIVQNVGGIGNLTCVPPTGSPIPTIAFDTGPGNMVMDALMQKHFGKPYDRGGRIAARGSAANGVVQELLLQPFFAQKPPRSAGREQFGAEFCARLEHLSGKAKITHEDMVATATALTARSIADACARWLQPGLLKAFAGKIDLIIAGGGAHNTTLLRMLNALLAPMGISVMTCEDGRLPTPLPVEAKEAVAFALLAYRSWHGIPGNVSSATGAKQAAILGQVTCA
jgi:anhydro-N-acetylmuramic acid kinase